ncbi:solute carrier family 16 member 6b [Osmerus mordax]|uniref:solute carrier family 16 member 6b n=1 Tax=Osmerus mordax TaxID=8014 RepID=UPI003510CA95
MRGSAKSSSPAMRGLLGPCVYPAVPDGGWGWAVALAFFLVEVFTYGTIKSLGVFLQDLMEEFQESNSRVSWVISICVFVLTFTAPLSTVLSNRFGYRPVVMAGGFLISLGTISSAYTSSINEMYVTIGLVSGLGYCLTFLPTVTLLAQYFSRRRSLVTAVASSGESFAMFAFAPAFTYLKEKIGWRHCLIVIGVLQASVIGCGVLLRPIVIKPEGDEAEGSQAAYELEHEETRASISSGVSGRSGDSGVTSLSTTTSDLRTVVIAEETAALMEPKGKAREDQDQGSSLGPPTQAEGPEAGVKEQASPQESRTTPKLLDFSVLKDGAFICYSLFGLFATLGFFAPPLYIIELSKSRGVEPDMAAYMLSIMAVAEVCGRLSIGVVLDKAPVRKTKVLLGCVVLLGLVLVAFTLVWEFWGLAMCCGLYGFFMGTVGSTHIPMLAEEDVVGIQRMPSSVGVYVFIQSFAGLAGPPLGGVLVDVTQNYGAAFYSCAAGMALGALFLALVGPAHSGMCRQRKRQGGGKGCDPEEETSQDSGSADFLEVDLAVEDSPAKTSQPRQGPTGNRQEV